MNDDPKQNLAIGVFGLPGTGKTTFARRLADELEALHLNSDILRSEMDLRGRYDPETKARIYRELLDRCRRALRSGETVVVDATFYRESLRRDYEELVDEEGRELMWIELQASESTIRKRVETKRAYSEADFEVYKKIRKEFEELSRPHLVLSSDQMDLPDMIAAALKHLGRH
ncbi:MAG: AAA family ATPase [Saprospiraceae bacterium]|nr:AAA family ATPase [Saprospiraceae bacterium]